MKKYWSAHITPLFFTNRWYAALIGCVILFVCRFFLPWLGILPYAFLLTLIVLLVADYLLLFKTPKGIFGRRTHADRFSNGDDNPIQIDIENRYRFPVTLEVIDEIPQQFQRRDVLFKAAAKAKQNVTINYELRPLKRGAYHFGTVNIFVSNSIGLINRRYKFEQPADVHSVLRHRIILTPEKEMEGSTPDDVIETIVKKIEVPR